MKKHLILLLFVFITSCGNSLKNNNFIKISIYNNTQENITNIMLYGNKFKNLKPSEISNYTLISIDNIKNNAIFTLDSQGKTFNMYIDNTPSKKSYTFQIDSLNIKNRYIYFKTK